MDDDDVKPGATEASAPPTRAPHADGGGAKAGPGKHLSAKRKLVAVQRLMRGESLEAGHLQEPEFCRLNGKATG